MSKFYNLGYLLVFMVFSTSIFSQNLIVTDDPSVTTSSSLVHFHKSGSAGASLLQMTSGTTGSASTNGFKIGIESDLSVMLGNLENSGLGFYTNNLKRLNIQNDGNIVIGGAGITSPGTANLLQIIGGGDTPSSLGASSLVELDAPGTAARVFNFRMSESSGTAYPAFSFTKSKGTLMAPLNLSQNDSVGSYMFTGFVGGAWKTLARITCFYTGDGNTQAGQILFQTANGGDPATQMSISPTGVTNFSGDVNYNLVQGSMYLENGAYTPTMPLKNVYYKVSPSMTVSSSNGITVVPDSITVLTSGSYKIDFVIDMQGSNGNDFRVKMFRNHSPAGVAGSATITTLGAGNKVCLSYFYFINVVAGDVLSFWVTNLSNNTNPCTINDMKVYIEKKPQH